MPVQNDPSRVFGQDTDKSHMPPFDILQWFRRWGFSPRGQIMRGMDYKIATGSATGDLTVTLDYCKHLVEVWVQSSAAATFYVYGSVTGEDGTWRLCDEIVVTATPWSGCVAYDNTRRFVRVVVSNALDNEVEITSA